MASTGNASAGEILALVRSGRVRTRRELQDVTGLSRSTLSIRMNQLVSAGYLRETGQVTGSTGRPAKILAFDEEAQLVVAVDLGVTHSRLALIDGSGRTLAETSGELQLESPDEALRYVARRVTELVAQSGRAMTEVVGVGVGIPGPVRFDTQRPNTPPLMPGWHDLPVAQRLGQALGVPVYLDNDANLMGLGEARARYPDAPSVLFVKVGTGIGAGVILHGQPERGIAGGAGDIGHIRIVRSGGRQCTCGAFGCLATEASGAAILRDLRESGVEIASIAQLRRLVAAGDPAVQRLTERAGHLLGEVLATSVALLNPAVLVVGGLVPAVAPGLLDAVRESVFQGTVPLATRELTIAASALAGDAAVQGARHMVIDRVFAPEAVDARLALAAEG